MKKISLVDRIENWFKKHPNEFVCGGEIQTHAATLGYEPQNAGRRLRELVNDGILEVEYRKGNNKQDVAYYRYKPTEKIITKYDIINGLAVAREEKIWT